MTGQQLSWPETLVFGLVLIIAVTMCAPHGRPLVLRVRGDHPRAQRASDLPRNGEEIHTWARHFPSSTSSPRSGSTRSYADSMAPFRPTQGTTSPHTLSVLVPHQQHRHTEGTTEPPRVPWPSLHPSRPHSVFVVTAYAGGAFLLWRSLLPMLRIDVWPARGGALATATVACTSRATRALLAF